MERGTQGRRYSRNRERKEVRVRDGQKSGDSAGEWTTEAQKLGRMKAGWW